MKTEQLKTRVTPELKESFELVAQNKGMSPSDALRYLIIKFIEESNKN